MKKTLIVFLLLVFSFISCKEMGLKTKKDNVVEKIVLTSSTDENRFEYVVKNKGSIIFEAKLKNKNDEDVDGVIEWQSNLPEECQIIEEGNNYTVNLDSIKTLGTYFIKAVYKDDKSKEESFNICVFTSENLNCQYSYILSNEEYYDEENEIFIELDKNGNKITRDEQRISFDTSISVTNTGENGICLFTDSEKFGLVDYEVSENENFLFCKKDNFLYIVPVNKINKEIGDELSVKVIAGDKEKRIEVKINNNANTQITIPTIYNAENTEGGGVSVNITGDSVGISNFLFTSFFRKDENEEWAEFSEFEKSNINYGESYKIQRKGEYKVVSFVTNKIGEMSESVSYEFVVNEVGVGEIESYFNLTSKNSTQPSVITTYQEDEKKSSRQALYTVNVDNCIYNTNVHIEYKSSDEDFESYIEDIDIKKNTEWTRSFKGAGAYKIIYRAKDNFTFGNTKEEDINDENSVVNEFVIKNADDINALDIISEEVSSNSDNTQMYSKIIASDSLFSLYENAVVRVSVFNKNTKAYKTCFNLSNTSKNYTYTITDTNEYEIIYYVYVSDKVYVSDIKKMQIFATNAELKAKPSINQSDDIQDEYDKRKVIITNTKNFNGQGRKLSYAWSSSTSTPNSWTLLTNGGENTVKYSIYNSNLSNKYLFLKQEPYNENLKGESIFYTKINFERLYKPTINAPSTIYHTIIFGSDNKTTFTNTCNIKVNLVYDYNCICGGNQNKDTEVDAGGSITINCKHYKSHSGYLDITAYVKKYGYYKSYTSTISYLF